MSIVTILAVTDGEIDTGYGATGIGGALDVVQDAETLRVPGEKFSVIRAQRGTRAVPPGKHLLFEETSLRGVDQLWLFGQDVSLSARLTDPEVKVISTFMDAGGGVFATGDHGDAGAPLCARLPRVKWMRRWYSDTTRRDALAGSPITNVMPIRSTVWPPTLSAIGSGTDTDSTGKLIWPLVSYSTGTHPVVHPIFRHGVDKAIRWLPDHIHEGECADYSGTAPLPEDAEGDFPEKLHPETIAWAVMATGERRGVAAFASRPEFFSIACAYNGHALSSPVGRIVTDSTFHHWIDAHWQNLIPDQQSDARQYFLNVARWLLRP